MDVRSVRNDPAFTCDRLIWCLRQSGMLPARGAEPVAASVPAPRHIPGAACGQPRLGPVAAALRPGPARCSRRCGAPSRGQANLTPAPLPVSEAAGFHGWCSGLGQLTAPRGRNGPAPRATGLRAATGSAGCCPRGRCSAARSQGHSQRLHARHRGPGRGSGWAVP